MAEFIQQYAGSVAAGAAVIIIVAAAVAGMIKDKRSGKSRCGGDCSHCHGCSKQTK